MTIEKLSSFIDAAPKILKGKDDKILLVLTNIIAKGHTLIEDNPGVGKTTLAKIFSKGLNLKLSRIQFTNDLLPSDIIGSQIFNKDTQEFHFHKGPIFGELILADELNRATPKTQSALLQVMEERKINHDSVEYELPVNFTVIATQNPNSQIGTFNLPESQLDRFSMKLDIGYPDKDSTMKMLQDLKLEQNLESLSSEISSEEIIKIQNDAEKIHIEDNILELIYKLLEESRTNTKYIPLSNRAAIDLVQVLKAYAYLQKRSYVIPDDLHFLFPYVCGHRLVTPDSSSIELEHNLANELLQVL